MHEGKARVRCARHIANARVAMPSMSLLPDPQPPTTLLSHTLNPEAASMLSNVFAIGRHPQCAIALAGLFSWRYRRH